MHVYGGLCAPPWNARWIDRNVRCSAFLALKTEYPAARPAEPKRDASVRRSRAQRNVRGSRAAGVTWASGSVRGITSESQDHSILR